jgi:hypothetical protein
MKFMQDYKENLLKLDADNSDDLISNGSKDHAQALIYQFLEGAFVHFRLLTCTFSSDAIMNDLCTTSSIF